ncbi:MAG: serine/threonine protein kinase [Planctomycetaceae bacterium]|jgi:serine/threonine protein kinase|nr:serine/threonine protein kinase [Planctomycetaceae bacterium]
MSGNLSIDYFGDYRLLNLVNTGQSSQLWQAYNDRRRFFVCIKTLVDRVDLKTDQIKILKWEYEVAVKLSHPKLIKIIEFGWQREVPYLVMEWFAAPNLKALINRGYAQYCEYLPQLFSDMAESLVYLHSQGWTHRDIKPDNFLFDVEKRSLKLIDFALARREPSWLAKLFTKKIQTQGTGTYIAPEQIRGQLPSPSVDIYSLGCTFFEMLTTRPPFSGDNMNDLLRKHLTANPPPVTLKNKNVTKEFSDILKSMLAKDANERPKTTTELLQKIKTTKIFKKTQTKDDLT